MRPMRAAASYALARRSSVALLWGLGHLASDLKASSGATMREAIAGSTDGMRPRPRPCASCMAAKALASWVGREKALVSLQHACSSLRYSSEGGTDNVAGAGLRLKNALTGAESARGDRGAGEPGPCV